MTSTLTRLEKISILKGAAAGRPLNALLPKVSISLIEDDIGWYTVLINEPGQLNNVKRVSTTEAVGFVDDFKKQAVGRIVQTHYINNDDYLNINEKLESWC